MFHWQDRLTSGTTEYLILLNRDMSKNRISVIPDEVFGNLSNLKTL